MATNKKITQLDELTPATWADDDVIAIVDISAQETKKIQLSTFRGAVTGVSSLNASTPLTVDSATGDVTISVAIDGGGTINAVFDEDDMTSNSPTALATQQSIKAYVDSQIITVDSLSEVLALGNTTGGTDLSVSTGDDITFADSSKAIFGAGSDLTIWHDASNSYIQNTTGSLNLQGKSGEASIVAAPDGAVSLYYDNASKFATTATGVDVTGTIVGDGLTLTTGATVTTVLDEDNMASNSATALSTQQSIKAYVDAQVGTADTLSEVLALGNTTGGTDIAMTGGDKITNFESTGINDDATSTAITIDSSENVGIGTAAPALNLHVHSSADTALLLTNTTSGSDADSGLEIKVINSGAHAYINQQEAADLILRTNDTDRMRITSSGNVGIGTSSPAQALDVVTASSNAYIRVARNALAAGQAGLQINGGTGGVDWYLFQNTGSNNLTVFGNGSERMRIDSGGNVGIGTTSPDFLLDVAGRVGILEGTNGIAFHDGAGSVSAGVRADSGDNLIFATGSSDTERMRIDSSGNLTMAATQGPALMNEDASNTNPTLIPRKTDTGTGWGSNGANNLEGIVGSVRSVLFGSGITAFYASGGSEVARIDRSSGNVGIGTSSPSEKLSVEHAGDVAIEVKSTGTGDADAVVIIDAADTGEAILEFRQDGVAKAAVEWFAGGSPDFNFRTEAGTDGVIDFQPNNSLAMRIDSGGNVGIGVTTVDTALGTKLHVAGTIRTDTGSANSNPAIVFDHDNFGDADANYIMLDRTNEAMRFNVNASERMRITSSGNVGIGTSAPGDKLQINSNSASTDPVFGGTTDQGIRLQNSNATAGNFTSILNVNSAGTLSSMMAFRNVDHSTPNTAGAIDFVTRNGGSLYRAMTIAETGNVGIGTSSPYGQLTVSSGGASSIYIADGASSSTSNRYIAVFHDNGLRIQTRTDASVFVSNDYSIDNNASGATTHRWNIANSEKMRIDSSGNVAIATTSSVGSDSTGQGFWFDENEAARFSRASNACSVLNRITTTGTVQSLRYNGAQVGSISVTASATAYNTSSDYRLKENVVNLSGAIDRVKLLKPSRFNFIADPDTTVDGFVAHEVLDIVPEAVHGEKDAVDADGNPEYQGIDQSKLVPVLTAALQEALTKIEALEARIVALETA